MHDKIALFCDLNEITEVTPYQTFYDVAKSGTYNTCIVYNTNDFFVQGIRDHSQGTLSDEGFFQIGDTGSTRPIKTPRLHLDAVEKILTDIHPSTLYVIDNSSKIAYSHVHGSRDDVEKKCTEQGSTIFAI